MQSQTIRLSGPFARAVGSAVALYRAPRGRSTLLAALALAGLLSGCTLPTQQLAVDEQPVIQGASARRNYTPLEPAFVCLAYAIRDKNLQPISVAVGDVKDYTGKYSQNEGNAVTQGGALMIYSALGKMGGMVQLHERFDTRIAELELAYTDRRQLGDGRVHTVENGKPAVPWVPYYGGSILRSNYYIVGGITELNYNIQSGGFDASVSLVGGKYRTYTMNVGVDLRIIDTRTLLVVKTVSIQKQIRGQEVGAGVYRFFNNELVDVTVGSKNQEPLQLGVRTTIEYGVLELMGAVSGVDTSPCITGAISSQLGEEPLNTGTPEGRAQKAAYNAPPPPASAASAPKAGANGGKPNGNGNGNGAKLVDQESTQSGLPPQNALTTGQAGNFELPFEFSSPDLSTQAQSQIENLVTAAAVGEAVSVKLAGRDNEVFPPMQRHELTTQRIKAVTDALTARGIAASRIRVTWLPDSTDASITRLGSGYQQLAILVISK